MKLPFKPIAILVIISLLGIFIYQAYWITGLYKTMKHELEQSIVEAMRMSDYNEMMLRVKAMQKENKAHGSVEVSAGYNPIPENHLSAAVQLLTKQTVPEVVHF